MAGLFDQLNEATGGLLGKLSESWPGRLQQPQQSQQPQSGPIPPEAIDALRRALMQQQMQQSQGISAAVPRAPGPGNPIFAPNAPSFKWDVPASQMLPELPYKYQPPQYWNYGQPVRMA